MSGTEAWGNILREGEEVLWQGKPDGGFYLHRSRVVTSATGAIMLVAGLIVFGVVLKNTPATFMIVFAVFWLGGVVWMLAKSVIWPNLKRRGSFYTLTDQRAIIGANLPMVGRSLDFYEIEASGQYEFVPGRLGSIIFDHVEGDRVNNKQQHYAVGFMRFGEAEKVWAMVQELQAKMRAAQFEATKDFEAYND